MRRNWSTALEQRVRAADATARIMVEGRVEVGADVRYRYDQWNLADDGSGGAFPSSTVESLPDGGVRLKATGSGGVSSTTNNAHARSKQEFPTATAPFMDPLSPSDAVWLLSAVLGTRLWAAVQWGTADSTEAEITQIQASLNPRFDFTQEPNVVRWKCQLYAVTYNWGSIWELVPLCPPVYKGVNVGEADGFVTFDFTQYRPKPKKIQVKNQSIFGILVGQYLTAIQFTGEDKFGNPARNIALDYDSAHDSIGSLPSDVLSGVLVRYLPPTIVGSGGNVRGVQTPGAISIDTWPKYVPAVKVILGSHTGATVGFTKTTNQILATGNLIPDGSFETGVTQVADVTGSGLSAGPTQDGTHVWDGAFGCAFTTVATAGVGVFFRNLDASYLAVEAGKNYQHTLYVFATGAAIGKTVHADVTWLDRNNNPVGTAAVGSNVVLASGWNRLQVAGIAPTNAVQCYPAFRQNGANAVQYWIDGAQFSEAANDIEFAVQAELPPGTSIATTVSADGGANYVTFKDGDRASDLGLPNQLYYKVKATLSANSAGDRSPILRAIGARNLTSKDLSEVVTVESVGWAMDPTTHKSEIAELVLRVLHDGERDFRDAITTLLSTYPLGRITLRLRCGDTTLTKDKWVLLDDFLIDEIDPSGSDIRITAVNPLCLLRGALPPFTDQTNAIPNADISNPGAWTISGGSILYTQLADSEGLYPWKDGTYVQSPNNPTNAAFTVGLSAVGTPLLPDGTPQRAGIQLQYRLYLQAGTTLQIKAELLQAGVSKATDGYWNLTAVAPSVILHTFTLSPQQLSSITNWSQLQLKITANGTGQVRVTWARLAIQSLREAVTYQNQLVSDVINDILFNQIAVDGRFLGALAGGVNGIAVGASTLAVGKVIAAPPGGVTDLGVAKSELDALGYVAGGFFSSSGGRITYKQLYDLSFDAASGMVVFQPSVGTPVAFIPMEELAEPITISPGYRQRVPDFYVPWGFDFNSQSPTANSYLGEARGVNVAALKALGVARIEVPPRLDDTAAKWIQSQGHANGVALRHVQAFGTGLLVARFRTTYAYPELELGDTIAFQTDRFVAFDPTADTLGRGIAGPQWFVGIVVGIFDVWGRSLAVWIPSYAGIGSGAGPGTKAPGNTDPALDLVINGGFEQGLSRWVRDNTLVTTTLETATTDTYLGKNSLKFDSAGTGGISVNLIQTSLMKPRYGEDIGGYAQQLLRVVPGSVLTGYATAKWGPAGGGTANLQAWWYDIDGNLLSTSNLCSWSAETTYTTKSGTATVPATAAFAGIVVAFTSAVGSTKFWVDEIHATAPGASLSNAVGSAARAATL